MSAPVYELEQWTHHDTGVNRFEVLVVVSQDFERHLHCLLLCSNNEWSATVLYALDLDEKNVPIPPGSAEGVAEWAAECIELLSAEAQARSGWERRYYAESAVPLAGWAA